jgi:hypothetical protein
MFGMSKRVFRSLVYELRQLGGLSDSRWVAADEKVAIFLRGAVSNGSNRELQERFMRGAAMISKSACASSILNLYHSPNDTDISMRF